MTVSERHLIISMSERSPCLLPLLSRGFGVLSTPQCGSTMCQQQQIADNNGLDSILCSPCPA